MSSKYIPQTDRLIHQCDFMSGVKALTLTHKAEAGITMNHVYRMVKRHIHTYLKTSMLNEVKFVSTNTGETLNGKTRRLKKAHKTVKPKVRLNGKTPSGIVPFLNLVEPKVIAGGCFLDVDALTAVP